MNSHQHTSWIEIDLNAIRHNLRNLKQSAAPANVLAVVKSEAYGHGL
ncbi:MAG: alanine racemase, partial [bacterium]|nr:alanine racemase [bacterium]